MRGCLADILPLSSSGMVCHHSTSGPLGCGGLVSFAHRQPSELTCAEGMVIQQGSLEATSPVLHWGERSVHGFDTKMGTTAGGVHLGCSEEEDQSTGKYEE